MNVRSASIALIGPGGAGKSTAGIILADRLQTPFVDLDQCFRDRAGDISEYINQFGYTAYARENVETYRSSMHGADGRCVVALSSGFMTYPRNVHPDYARLHRCIEQSPTTVVLLPSLDLDVCVAETVRRQLDRPFARSAGAEEGVIRERFPIYVGLRVRKIETMRPLSAIVDELVMRAGRLGHSSLTTCSVDAECGAEHSTAPQRVESRHSGTIVRGVQRIRTDERVRCSLGAPVS